MTYILYNPQAGKGNVREAIAPLLELYGTESILQDVTEQAYAALLAGVQAGDTVILCGGDGTLNRFVNDTEGVELPCELLYFAIGTGNDFLTDLGRREAAGVTPIAVKEYIRDLPVVTVNGKQYRFLNNVGFGIDGYCCEVGDRLKATSDKPVNYTAIAIKGLLFHYAPTNATLTVDGREYSYKRVWLCPTMKGRFYGGGMMATPRQDRNDPTGKLSVMLFYGKGRLRTLIAFPSIFKGAHVKHTKMVAIHEGYDVHVRFDRPTPLQIDGETILGVTEYRATAKQTARTDLPAGANT